MQKRRAVHRGQVRLAAVQVGEVSSLGGATSGKRTQSNDAQLQRGAHRKVMANQARLEKVFNKTNSKVLQVNAPPGPGAQKSGFRHSQMQQPRALLSLASAGPSSAYPQFCVLKHL